jgi:UDP-glucose 4-epimerase
MAATDLDEQFRGRRVVITGGLGFIGSNLAHRLGRAGASVMLIDSLVPEYGGNLFNVEGRTPNVTINISDVRDPHAMKYLVKGQDYLFNLAGQTSHMDSMKDPHTDLEINCRAQLSILEACRASNPDVKIVFASTRQIYGKPDYLPVDEKHPLRPVDVNGINKLAGEHYHILYTDVYGIRTCALRLTNTYGPRMRIKDARQTFLGIWVRLLLESKPFEVWEGHQLRDFTFVDDAVEALMMTAIDDRANGRVFNLGGGEVISLADLASLLVKINGSGEYTSRSFPADRKRIDIGDYYSDPALIARTIGWGSTTPLRVGLKRTLDFYREHLTRYV